MLLAVTVLVLGILFGVAAQTTDLNKVGAERARTGLLDDIEQARENQGVLASSAAVLADELAATRSALGVQIPSLDAADLALAAGSSAVTGPGIRVVIGPGSPPSATTDAAGSQAQRAVIADRDIQLLVNGMWAAGAEAVTVGGVRLRPTSAIRQAGGAVLVDNAPVFFPITVEAIGNPSTLPAQFARTTGFGRFNSFAQLYGIQFDLTVQDSLTAPAGSGPDLRFAEPTPTPTADPSPPSAFAPAAGEDGGAPGSSVTTGSSGPPVAGSTAPSR